MIVLIISINIIYDTIHNSVTNHNINQRPTYCPSSKWVVATITQDEYYAIAYYKWIFTVCSTTAWIVYLHGTRYRVVM